MSFPEIEDFEKAFDQFEMFIEVNENNKTL